MAAKKITQSKFKVPEYKSLVSGIQLSTLPLYSTHKERHLEDEMKIYIDSKICNLFPLGLPDCYSKRNPQEIFCLAMQAMTGLTEEFGYNDGKWIQLIQETYGNAANESWCMATIQTALAYAELYTGIISVVPATEGCLYAWDNVHPSFRRQIPAVGFLVLWQHYKLGKPTSQGHVGSVEGVEAKSIHTIEGNTGKGDGIQRDGDGVYERSRRLGGEGNMKQLGFIDPFPGYAVDLNSLTYRVISANFVGQ